MKSQKHEKVQKPNKRDHILYASISMKCPEKANLKTELAGYEQGLTVKCHEESYWGDEDSLKLFMMVAQFRKLLKITELYSWNEWTLWHNFMVR